ncbi:MAG: hypothetical protein IKK43_03570 [Clostridia bacterium]|nr:hypothetical protein [Clostridia bacterium]
MNSYNKQLLANIIYHIFARKSITQIFWTELTSLKQINYYNILEENIENIEENIVKED